MFSAIFLLLLHWNLKKYPINSIVQQLHWDAITEISFVLFKELLIKILKLLYIPLMVMKLSVIIMVGVFNPRFVSVKCCLYFCFCISCLAEMWTWADMPTLPDSRWSFSEQGLSPDSPPNYIFFHIYTPVLGEHARTSWIKIPMWWLNAQCGD